MSERRRGRHTPQGSWTAPGPAARQSEGCLLPALALIAAATTTAWWGIAGLGTENFGSDCLFYFGERGPRAEHCFEVNDRAEAMLPALTKAAWIAAAVTALPPRIVPGARITGAVVALLALTLALALGVHAMAVSTP